MSQSSSHQAENMPSISVIFAIVALLVSFALSINLIFMHHQSQAILASQLDSLKHQVENSFARSIDELDNKFSLILSNTTQVPAIIQAIEDRQRQTLYQLVRKNYQLLKAQEPNLFVMHFFDPNNTTILRLHKPESFDDDLTNIRPIVTYVNRTKTQKSGFEPGKNGITYRITAPIFNAQQRHLGVLEFGIRPDYFKESLQQQFAVNVRTLIKTENLQNLTYKTNFPKMGDYSIIGNDPLFEALQVNLNQAQQIIEHEGRFYLAITDIFLNSYLGEPMVEFQVIKDITHFYHDYDQQNQLYLIWSLCTYAFFLLFLYFVFNRYQTQLRTTIQDLKHSKQQQRQTLGISQTDELTKAFNRRYYNQVIEEKFANNELITTPYSMIFFDIDHFKHINDTHGHLIGDQILIELAEKVKQLCREHDLLFRWGGEEFAILLKDTELPKAIEIADRLRVRIEQHNHWPESIHMTISLGVIQLKPHESFRTMQHRLDNLLYKAKERGRNCIQYEQP